MHVSIFVAVVLVVFMNIGRLPSSSGKTERHRVSLPILRSLLPTGPEVPHPYAASNLFYTRSMGLVLRFLVPSDRVVGF